jgi:trimethylamine--corrinoid protein Co-methyltransferase
MDTGEKEQTTIQFRILSDGQIETLYEATLACLARTGVHVMNEEARALLAKAGARVDSLRAYIPPQIIRDAVAASPRSFPLWGRDERRRLEVQPGGVYFGPGPTCTYFMDPHTGERRKARRGDPGLTALVCDALDNIDYVMGLGLIDDVPHDLAPVHEFAEMVANSGKPVLPWGYTPRNVADIYRIAVAAAGGEETLKQQPFFAFFSTFQSPLIHTDEDVANAFWAAERAPRRRSRGQDRWSSPWPGR